MSKPDLVALSAVSARIVRAFDAAADRDAYWKLVDHAATRKARADMATHTPGLAAEVSAAATRAWERIHGVTIEGGPIERNAA